MPSALGPLVLFALVILPLAVALGVSRRRRSARRRACEAAVAEGEGHLERARAHLEAGDREAWLEAQHQAVDALTRARTVAPQDIRLEVEMRLNRERLAWESSFVWPEIERARGLLDDAKSRAEDDPDRRRLAEEALDALTSAKRQNHRPEDIGILSNEAKIILGKAPAPVGGCDH